MHPGDPFPDFHGSLSAPPQPDFDIDATMKWLKSGPAAVLTTPDRWTLFEKAPKDQESEDEAFGPISEIFTKIVEAIIATGAKLIARLITCRTQIGRRRRPRDTMQAGLIVTYC